MFIILLLLFKNIKQYKNIILNQKNYILQFIQGKIKFLLLFNTFFIPKNEIIFIWDFQK